jgi:hypothetical protein
VSFRQIGGQKLVRIAEEIPFKLDLLCESAFDDGIELLILVFRDLEVKLEKNVGGSVRDISYLSHL